MSLIEVDNESELINALAGMDITVPLRSSGCRTHEHTERHAMALLLSALARTDRISYPLKLDHRIRPDRPDFLLTSGGTMIGIEHTEAVPDNAARKQLLSEKGYGRQHYPKSHHSPGESRKSNHELIHELETKPIRRGRVGDSMEKELAEAMFHFVKRKVAKLQKDGFERFDEDWLLIYNNWVSAGVDILKTAVLLLRSVSECGALEQFTRVFIITGDHVCEFSHASIHLFPINNLWA